MAGLQDFRAQHPEYNDMPDAALADALYAKFYSDIPKDKFAAQMGLTADPTAKAEPMSAGDVALGAITNLPSSTAGLVKNIGQAVLHPIDTGAAIVNAGRGAGQELAHTIRGDQDPAPTPQTQAFDAVKSFYGSRYGSGEGFKRAVANDPAGVLADASIVASGAGLAAKAGGLTKAAALADKLGTVSNPIALAGSGIKGAANLGGKTLAEILGITTGAGGQSIRTAYGAGLKGGTAAEAVADQMRGHAPIEEVVSDAKAAVGNLKDKRGANYRAAIGPINADPTVLSMGPIDQAINQTSGINNFKGVDLSPSTATTRQKINDVVSFWKQQNPVDFHTAAGFDALKKSIGDIRDSAPYGSPDRLIADQAYNAVKSQIVAQAPAYAKTMQDYAGASRQIDEISKTLSLGPNANVDTSLRKLQSALRDNVNTSFGRRTDLAKMLADNGATDLMEKIAGQTLRSPTSRGLGKLLTSGEIASIVPTAYVAGPVAAAGLIPPLLASSPRLMGELALGTGKGARIAKLLAKTMVSKPKDAAQAALVADELSSAQQN